MENNFLEREKQELSEVKACSSYAESSSQLPRCRTLSNVKERKISCLGNSSKLMFSDKILKVLGVLQMQLTIGGPAEHPLDHGSVPHTKTFHWIFCNPGETFK